MKTINKSEIKRFFMISDLHFGVRSNNQEWLNIQKDYFYNFFIPYVKENKRKGDACFILGDIFDSRQLLNILVLHTSIGIFKDLSDLFGETGVFIMTGNHDCWTKDSADIHSLKCLEFIPNIYSFDKPTTLKTQDLKLIFLPWGFNTEEEKEFLEKNSSDYLFVHTDIKGARFGAKVEVEHGNGEESYTKHRKVYGGHLHHRQRVNDFITLIGCPYQMTRSDLGNKKGIYVVDLETKTEQFIENNYSPEFISANFESLLELSKEQIQNIFYNKFVDLKVSRKWLEELDIPGFVQTLTTQRSITIQEVEEDHSLELDDALDIDFTDEATPKFDILTLTKELVRNLEYDEETKNKIENKVALLFEKITDEEAT